MIRRLLASAYDVLVARDLPRSLENALHRRGHLTLRIVKDDAARPVAKRLIRAILAVRSSPRCVAHVLRIEQDKQAVAATLGELRADPAPLPFTSFATEADALFGCATPAAGGRLLYATVASLKPARAVEIGTAHGYGALYVGSALHDNGKGKLWTLEGMAARIALSRDAVARFNLRRHVEVVDGDFHETLPRTLSEAAPLDLLFADGDKEPETTRRQFDMAMQAMSAGGHMFYDDIDFSPEIRTLWREHIVSHPRVRMCVVFSRRWGLLKVAPA